MFRKTTLRGCGVDLHAQFPYFYPGFNPCPTPFPMQQVQPFGVGQQQAGVAYPVTQETTQRPFRGGRG